MVAQLRLLDQTPMLLPQVGDGARCIGRLLGCLHHAPQEEVYPPFPIAILANSHEPIVVFGAMALKKIAQIEQGAVQHATATQQERDEEAPDAPIAIQERVNGLELSMGQRAVNQDG